MAAYRFIDPNTTLPTRETDAHTATQPAVLGATYGREITSSARVQDVRLELPTASDYPGLDFLVTHVGDFLTTVVDEDGRVLWETQLEGQSALFECDGTAWLVSKVNTEDPPAAAELRIWDTALGDFRQATSPQDAIDSTHTLLFALVKVMKERRMAELPQELEIYYERNRHR